MSKAKVKVTVRKGAGNGALLTKVPLQVKPNDNPTGNKMYQTKAQVSIRIKTTRSGKPRLKR